MRAGAAGRLSAIAPASWAENWQAWRDRRLASARFRRWAERFPPTRPLARRRAGALFDIVTGFVHSQVLLGCVRLRLFDTLAAGPLDLAGLAERTRLAPARLERLLDAAVALELLERRGASSYGLGALGAPMVDNAGLVAMVEHHATLYADLADPVALLRGDGAPSALSGCWAYAGRDDARALPEAAVAGYSALMAASNALVADQLLDRWPLARHRCLLDVGGGEGVFLAAAAARAPHLRLMLFDLPAVAARAQRRLAALGLDARAQALGGDFLHDALPEGADLITLLRVLHDHDDTAAATLLRAALRALPRGGTLLVAEPLRATPGAQAMGDAYFGLYLLAMGQGRPRDAAQLGALLHAAGFERVRHLPTAMPLQAGLLSARKP